MPLKMEIYVFTNLGVNYTFISMGTGNICNIAAQMTTALKKVKYV